jgi:hypothetical protein
LLDVEHMPQLRHVVLALLLAGCSKQLVMLAPVRTLPVRPQTALSLLEVTSSASSGADPLQVSGLDLAFDGLAKASAEYAAAASSGWAERHRHARPTGWEMSLEVIRGQAVATRGHLAIALESRVTVSSKAGHEHLGQTLAFCKVSEPLAGNEPARIVYLCIEQMSRNIGNWLEGLQP